jgi:hypothetical protein
MVDGLNGATRPVVSTWIVEADGPPGPTSTWWTPHESLRESTGHD